MPRRLILSIALAVILGGGVFVIYYRLRVTVVTRTLTNKAVLMRGTSVVFPICIYETVLGREERFPIQLEPNGPLRC